jgi:hypothetical protein
LTVWLLANATARAQFTKLIDVSELP